MSAAAGWITDIEKGIIDLAAAAFTRDGKSALKTVGSLPGEFTAESVAQMRIETPALYVLFLGGRLAQGMDDRIDTSWALYAVTSHQGGQVQRRHGDTREIGAYEIVSVAVAALNGVTVAGCGPFRIAQVENLFTGQLMKRAIAAYAATFTLPVDVPGTLDPETDLADFNIYHSDWTDEADDLPLPPGDHPVNHIDLRESE